MTEQCNRCRFWLIDRETLDPNDSDFAFGRCRLAPPVIMPNVAAMLIPRPVYGDQTDPDLHITSLFTASEHPATFATDWCGSFKAMPPSRSPIAEAYGRWLTLHADREAVDPDDPKADEKCAPIWAAIDAQAAIIRTTEATGPADLAAKLRVALTDIGSSSWEDDQIIIGQAKGDDLADADPGEKLVFSVLRHLEEGR